MEDTIAAISTPIGMGGISIIRISGQQSLKIADAVFQCRSGTPSAFATHTIHHGVIRDDGRLLDEVLLTVMRAPKTYTREDVVEINCHGGIVAARAVLSCCLKHGARLADPGEFTKRAFLNGRIDLTQAEAVMDLIKAQTDRAGELAAKNLEGKISQQLNFIRRSLVGILAEVEVGIDLPEEDVVVAKNDPFYGRVESVLEKINELLNFHRSSRLLRQGITVTLIGRTNAGKSSIMNAMLGEDRVLVSEVHGTTRDFVEEVTSINGVPIKLVDTAGIRNAESSVEKLGINKSHKALKTSDLLIHVIDSSEEFSEQDFDIKQLYNSISTIVVLNKSDKPTKCILPDKFSEGTIIKVSATHLIGISDLKKEIIHKTSLNDQSITIQEIYLNTRSDDVLQKVKSHVTAALSETLEERTYHLNLSLQLIDELTGTNTTEEVIETIFRNFCVGK